MSKPTQDLNFWKQRIKETGSIESGMAVGFHWPTIDWLHRKHIKKHIKSTDKILDAGCGYGRISDWFDDKHYTGVDFLPEFIEEARKRHPKKKFILADLTTLPFDDQEFDWAILVSVKVVIRSDPNGEVRWQEAQKELKRVCKKLLILEYGNSEPSEIEKHVEIL